MTKHKLDELVEDTLQHFGIKGMKWGVRRTDEQIASDEGSGGGGGGEVEGEEDESILEELNDTLDAFGKKLENITDAMKKKGYKLLEKIFGKSKVKISKAESNSKRSKKLIAQMKAYDKASPSERALMKKGYKIKVETSVEILSGSSGSKKTSGSAETFKTSSGRKYTAKTMTDKEVNALVKKLEKEGYKKGTVKKGKLKKNKDGSYSQKIGDNTWNMRTEVKVK